MDKSKQQELFEKFPLLYADRDKPPQESLMCFGLAVFNGWYDIIYNLSEKLELMIRNWIIENGMENYPRAIQVKEKFGSLCFYMTGKVTAEMREAIKEAQVMSRTVCEACGQPGELRSGTWLFTFCDECDKKKNTGWRPYMDEEK